jgi:hypothetical protein
MARYVAPYVSEPGFGSSLLALAQALVPNPEAEMEQRLRSAQIGKITQETRGLVQENDARDNFLPAITGLDQGNLTQRLPDVLARAFAVDPRSLGTIANTITGLYGDEGMMRRGLVADGHMPGENFAGTVERADQVARRNSALDTAKAIAAIRATPLSESQVRAQEFARLSPELRAMAVSPGMDETKASLVRAGEWTPEQIAAIVGAEPRASGGGVPIDVSPNESFDLQYDIATRLGGVTGDGKNATVSQDFLNAIAQKDPVGWSGALRAATDEYQRTRNAAAAVDAGTRYLETLLKLQPGGRWQEPVPGMLWGVSEPGKFVDPVPLAAPVAPVAAPSSSSNAPSPAGAKPVPEKFRGAPDGTRVPNKVDGIIYEKRGDVMVPVGKVGDAL